MNQLTTKRKIRVVLRSSYGIGLSVAQRADFCSKRHVELVLPQGSRVLDLLLNFPALGAPETFDDLMIHVFVNGKLRGFDHQLQPDDVVDIHIPVSGG